MESFRERKGIPEAEKNGRVFATSGKARRRFSQRRISRKRDRAGAFPKVGKRRAAHSILFGAACRAPSFRAAAARCLLLKILYFRNEVIGTVFADSTLWATSGRRYFKGK
ncbi:hypothetical protein GJ698_21670 [Pseudoduganella sp. FT26W]|uniref:Uncharacterized protein n=1 Tax=Duganella aquatilis TaxID=2666082 RepID=A0A844D6Z1_9BURK|nr:hypothetical protein [Duganella aquatilis]MRW86681.1 hypothetical protein [Duganella aquatilis]